MNKEKFWTLNMAEVGLQDSQNYNMLSDLKSRYAIMDTGVSYAIIPVDDFLNLKEQLKTAFQVNCTEPEKSSLTSTHTCTCPDHDKLPDI
jgi:hypothetical protein